MSEGREMAEMAGAWALHFADKDGKTVRTQVSKGRVEEPHLHGFGLCQSVLI